MCYNITKGWYVIMETKDTIKRARHSTRWYSGRQERAVAKAIGGKQTSNSGATAFHKGDVTSALFLIECKTVTHEQKSVTVKREWLQKNKEEAFMMGKRYGAVVVNFGDGENYYIVDEKTFLDMLEGLNEV